MNKDMGVTYYPPGPLRAEPFDIFRGGQASTEGDVGLIPGQRTKIPHAMWHRQKTEAKNKCVR